MVVTEPQRLALHAAARTTLGTEEGDALMASLPPANTEIATRQDIERLEARVDQLEIGLRGEMQRLENGLRQESSTLDTGLRQEIAHHADSVRKDLAHHVETSRLEHVHIEQTLRAELSIREERLRGDMTNLEERLRGAMAASISGACADLTKRIHASEWRTIAVILLAAIGDRLLG